MGENKSEWLSLRLLRWARRHPWSMVDRCYESDPGLLEFAPILGMWALALTPFSLVLGPVITEKGIEGAVYVGAVMLAIGSVLLAPVWLPVVLALLLAALLLPISVLRALVSAGADRRRQRAEDAGRLAELRGRRDRLRAEGYDTSELDEMLR